MKEGRKEGPFVVVQRKVPRGWARGAVPPGIEGHDGEVGNFGREPPELRPEVRQCRAQGARDAQQWGRVTMLCDGTWREGGRTIEKKEEMMNE
jgi:hypothetical protein